MFDSLLAMLADIKVCSVNLLVVGEGGEERVLAREGSLTSLARSLRQDPWHLEYLAHLLISLIATCLVIHCQQCFV